MAAENDDVYNERQLEYWSAAATSEGSFDSILNSMNGIEHHPKNYNVYGLKCVSLPLWTSKFEVFIWLPISSFGQLSQAVGQLTKSNSLRIFDEIPTESRVPVATVWISNCLIEKQLNGIRRHCWINNIPASSPFV